MKPEYLALALCMVSLTIVLPAIHLAFQGRGYAGLILALPVLPLVAFICAKFLPWAFREEDAQLMQLLGLFECLDAAGVLHKMGVKTTADLEYITPESLDTLDCSLITKFKLEDALRYH